VAQERLRLTNRAGQAKTPPSKGDDMKNLVLGLLVLGAASGCGNLRGSDDRLRFDGQVYRASASGERGDPATFTARASPASASLQGAAQAAAHEARRHCLRFFGTSEILWTTGPDSIADAPQLDRDTLTLAGTCVDRQG